MLWNWWVQYRSPADTIQRHADLLKLELCCYSCAVLTFVHAYRAGGRFRCLWIGVILQGILLELASYWIPNVNNYWHAQGTVMFFGQRLPLHIICLYTILVYTPCVIVARSGMKWWARPFAVGVTSVIFDLPLDILNTKHLFWTWHDSDPNVSERHYGVPWTNYFFIITCFSAFDGVFHGVHKLLVSGKGTWQCADSVVCESLSVLFACVMGTPLAVLQFVIIYHPLHDVFNIHGEVCTAVLLLLYGLVIWLGDRRTNTNSSLEKGTHVDEITTVVLIMTSFFLYLVLTSQPEKIVSTGIHEPVGPCNVTENIITPLGHVLSRLKYLCINNYNDKYYNFRCIQEPPTDGQLWYTICGTAYENRVEHIVVISSLSVLCMTWCITLMRSGSWPVTRGHLKKAHLKES